MSSIEVKSLVKTGNNRGGGDPLLREGHRQLITLFYQLINKILPKKIQRKKDESSDLQKNWGKMVINLVDASFPDVLLHFN